MRQTTLAAATLAALAASTGAFAGEGMWVPQQLPEIAGPLKKAGLELSAEQLSDLTGDPLGAVVSLGGFGRFVLDGQKQQNYSMMVAGAVLVAILAIVGDRILALIAHFVVSPGLTGRRVRARATTADMLVLDPVNQVGRG